MLDAYIIEKIKREQEDKNSIHRPRIEIPRRPPVDPGPPRWDDGYDDRDRDRESDRGVVIIEF